MMEIGFNAGHSAIFMLVANPTLRLTCFDINEHKYTKPCADFVKEIFGDRFTIVYGDSTVTVAQYEHKQPYDAAHIDGGHALTVAEKDWKNTYPLVRNGGIIVFDDTQLAHLQHLVQQKIKARLVEDISSEYSCTTRYKHAILRKTRVETFDKEAGLAPRVLPR
jgi:predicted O-methyltransferase YrrM